MQSQTSTQPPGLDALQVLRNRFGLIAFAFILVFALSCVVTYIMPRKYRGNAIIRIERQEIYTNPVVTVTIDDTANAATSRTVTVTGVIQPGKKQFKPGMTAMDAITEGGGPVTGGTPGTATPASWAVADGNHRPPKNALKLFGSNPVFIRHVPNRRPVRRPAAQRRHLSRANFRLPHGL
jgi:hypothetical protein